MKTDRLTVRAWKVEDAPRLYELAKSEIVGLRCGWSPHKNVDESREIIEKFLSKDGTYVIVLKDTNDIIGCISLLYKGNANIELNDYEAELGYWIGEDYWGKGYTVEAASALINFGFKEQGLSKIWCGNFKENRQSARVKEKLGFIYQYTIENRYVAAINEYKDDQLSVIINTDWSK